MATNRVSPKKGKVVDIPDATITIGTPTAGAGQVSIAFTVATTPATGGPVQKYTAVSNPDSVTVSGSTSPIVVTGLTNDTAYTIQVAAANATGRGPLSAASASATPADLAGFESISTVTVGSPVSSITFSSIPSTYKHLQIRYIARDTFAASLDYTSFKMNGASTGYSWHWLQGNGATVSVPSATSASFIQAGVVTYASALANTFAAGVLDILDYADANKYKTMRLLNGADLNGSGRAILASGLYQSTTAVTSLSFHSAGTAYATNSSFALYGIKG